MAHETRVNLRRLLEDIRDAYAYPVDEVIITELVANALDSGATHLEFTVDPEARMLRCTDNGRGMTRAQLKSYHDIASSAKERGRGIGFAGIGAKLSLLVAESVVTETRGPRGSRGATHWRLTGGNRAPWKFIPYAGHVTATRGTSVEIALSSSRSSLDSAPFVADTIARHFYPLIDGEMRHHIIRLMYPKGVAFSVNGEQLALPDTPGRLFFTVHIGARNRRPVGVGYLARDAAGIPSTGIALSTFGKVIKNGWEWLGMLPKRHLRLSGLVEIPGLAEMLTTNKADFLTDAANLKRYYRYRKAAQEAVLAALAQMGEGEEEHAPLPREITSLAREIESALGNLVPDFPELESLVGVRRKTVSTPVRLAGGDVNESGYRAERVTTIPDPYGTPLASSVLNRDAGDTLQGAREPLAEFEASADGPFVKRSAKKVPGLKIAFEEFTEPNAVPSLGRMIENTVRVNTAHPAWKKAADERLEEYHVVLTVAFVLSQFLEEHHAPHAFISTFLASWGQPIQKKLL